MRADLELSLDLVHRAGHPFFCKYKNSTPYHFYGGHIDKCNLQKQ